MKQGSQTSSSDVIEKKSFKERLLQPIIALLVVVAAIGGFLFWANKNVKQPEEYFVQYKNATTLVVIEYGEKNFWGYDSAGGFIDDHIYKDYKENMNLNGIIEIYHPYKKGDSVLVDANKIAKVITYTYQSFYNEYPPDKYE